MAKLKGRQAAFRGSAFLLLPFAFYLLAPAVLAQLGPDDLAPPPRRVVTKDERRALEALTDYKPRTKLALEFMDAHLKAAETHNAGRDFDSMFKELGGFQGLVDHTLLFLTSGDKKSGKVLDNLKRFEIALRGFLPRLQTIHRDLPIRYEDYVRRLIVYVRNARTKAIEPLFGDTVVPDSEE